MSAIKSERRTILILRLITYLPTPGNLTNTDEEDTILEDMDDVTHILAGLKKNPEGQKAIEAGSAYRLRPTDGKFRRVLREIMTVDGSGTKRRYVLIGVEMLMSMRKELTAFKVVVDGENPLESYKVSYFWTSEKANAATIAAFMNIPSVRLYVREIVMSGEVVALPYARFSDPRVGLITIDKITIRVPVNTVPGQRFVCVDWEYGREKIEFSDWEPECTPPQQTSTPQPHTSNSLLTGPTSLPLTLPASAQPATGFQLQPQQLQTPRPPQQLNGPIQEQAPLLLALQRLKAQKAELLAMEQQAKIEAQHAQLQQLQSPQPQTLPKGQQMLQQPQQGGSHGRTSQTLAPQTFIGGTAPTQQGVMPLNLFEARSSSSSFPSPHQPRMAILGPNVGIPMYPMSVTPQERVTIDLTSDSLVHNPTVNGAGYAQGNQSGLLRKRKSSEDHGDQERKR